MANFNPKLLNDPLDAADELLDGLVDAYNGECRKVGVRSLAKNDIPDGKVALLVGGGAGHEPIYHAMVGKNMADGAACGDIFAAPAPNIIQEATQAVDRGNGVLYLYGNYAGDILNFNLGAEMSAASGTDVRTVLIADDVCSAPPERKSDRRGIAGLVPIVKIVGAASQSANNLDDLARVAEKACLQTRSVGVAMAPGSIPATGKPTFSLEEGKIGLGLGIHGEAGVGEIAMTTADALTAMVMDLIYQDYINDDEVDALKEGDEVVVLINSLGSTTMMECLVCMRKVREFLEQKGIKIFDVIIGPYVTCQEMAGISFSLTRVDQELKEYWSMPCESFCISKMQGPLHTGPAATHDPITHVPSSPQKTETKKKQTVDLSKSSNGLSIHQARDMILKVADAIIAAEPILSQADRDLGDGDHGLGMARGFTAVKESLDGVEFASHRDLFASAGNAMLTTMGGASGVVFGSLFLAGGTTLQGADYFGSHELAHLLNRALADVMERGGAKPGDKTMIDALHPAAVTATKNLSSPLPDSLQATAQAARDGMEASKDMIATMGRAKTLGEKSLGLPDAGAISVTIILETMRDTAHAKR